MERAHREPAHGLFAEAVRQAFLHFGGGLTGEGDGGDPGGETPSCSISHAMRETSVRVLPVPGPAMTAVQAACVRMAASCSGLGAGAGSGPASGKGAGAGAAARARGLARAAGAAGPSSEVCPESISSSPGAKREITPYSPS